MKTLKKELVSIGRQYAGRDGTIDYYHAGEFSEAIADHIQRQTETLLARNEPLLAFQARVDALREYSDYSIDDSNGEYGLVMETMEDKLPPIFPYSAVSFPTADNNRWRGSRPLPHCRWSM